MVHGDDVFCGVNVNGHGVTVNSLPCKLIETHVSYQANRFENIITLYGRKPVLEILEDASVPVYRLHLAESNKSGDVMNQIKSLAADRGVEIVTHTKQALSRISKNGRQDQGVAVDVESQGYKSVEQLEMNATTLIALDNVTNPQNVGMIIRSVAASPIDGLLLPRQGCARIDPLVHKASAGTVFKSDIYHCSTLHEGLGVLKARGFIKAGLDGEGSTELSTFSPTQPVVYVLGNETIGLSNETKAACDHLISIPLARGVESINVAAAATLVAFRNTFR